MQTVRLPVRASSFPILAIVGLGAALFVDPPAVRANVRIEGGEVPFYARISHDEIFHTYDWAAVVFYRPPACVPADFNLLDFFDPPAPTAPGAFGCGPPTIDGFTIWKNGPFVDVAPIQARLNEEDVVPMWFVSWPELEDAIAGGVLTIGELSAMDSLQVGSAGMYGETLHPSESRRAGIVDIVARGVLEDGRSFQMQASYHHLQGRLTHIRIVFE